MTKQPEDTIRDGHLKATIWKNEIDKGSFHSTTLARTYEDKDGNLKDSVSFLSSDLLRISELARSAYTRSRELQQAQSKEQVQARPEQKQDFGREAFKNNRRENGAPQPIRENRR